MIVYYNVLGFMVLYQPKKYSIFTKDVCSPGLLSICMSTCAYVYSTSVVDCLYTLPQDLYMEWLPYLGATELLVN